jgi:hypothetical protein
MPGPALFMQKIAERHDRSAKFVGMTGRRREGRAAAENDQNFTCTPA